MDMITYSVDTMVLKNILQESGLPILKDPVVLTLTCVVVLWVFVLLNIVGPKMITRVQAIATVLALVPIVGIAVFGWFWFRGETYMAAWNVSGMNTFGAIQSTLNVTLWSFIGVESASVAAGVRRVREASGLGETSGFVALSCFSARRGLPNGHLDW